MPFNVSGLVDSGLEFEPSIYFPHMFHCSPRYPGAFAPWNRLFNREKRANQQSHDSRAPENLRLPLQTRPENQVTIGLSHRSTLRGCRSVFPRKIRSDSQLAIVCWLTIVVLNQISCHIIESTVFEVGVLTMSE